MILLSTDRFTYNSRTKSFSAELSELPLKLYKPLGPCYPKPEFTLASARTGEEVEMEFDSTTYDNDGDVMYWTFVPRRSALNIKVVIFND
jgi:hypothetical protein